MHNLTVSAASTVRFKCLIALTGMLLMLPGCGQKKTAAKDPQNAAPPSMGSPKVRPPPSEETPPPREDPRPPRKADPDAPYRCAQDSDCVTTCARGAINREFYFANRKRFPPECKDGCSSKGMKLKCIDKVCVAFYRGQRADHCTRKRIAWKKPIDAR